MSLPPSTTGGAPCLRRGVLAASLVLTAASLTACAAGNDAVTLNIRPDNAAVTEGSIEIQNAVVIAAQGSRAPVAVSAALINNGDEAQKLESVKVQGGGSLRLTPADGGRGAITVPAGGSVLLGGRGNPSATLPGTSAGEVPEVGDFGEVTFGFSETGEVALQASVVASEGYYEDFGPTSAVTEPDADTSPATEDPDTAEPVDAGESIDEGERGEAERDEGRKRDGESQEQAGSPEASGGASPSSAPAG